MKRIIKLRIVLALLLAALFSACGGGGGGGGNPNPNPNPAPGSSGGTGSNSWDEMVWDQDNWA